MRHKTHILKYSAVFTLLASAHAATLVYEPFDYTSTGFTDDDGASLGDGNQNGGIGFDGAWTSEVNRFEMEVRDEAMTFTDGGGNPLPTSGLSIRRSDRGGFTNHSRGVSPTATAGLTGDNTTMWMSFLYEDEGFSGPDSSVMLASEPMALSNNHALNSSGFGVGVAIGETGANVVSSAYYDDSATLTMVDSSFSPNDNENVTFLLAAKINWNPDGTPDELFVFNITDLTTEPLEGDAIASDTFDYSLAQQQALDTLNIGETQVDAFDEIRLGQSFSDVMQTNPIPEPGSLVLLGLGGVVLLRRQRA